MTGEGRARRGHVWVVWSLSSSILVLGAFLAGQYVKSPWASAEHNAEAGTVATVVVAEGTVATPVATATGTLSLGSIIDVAPAPAADGGRQVITSVSVAVGDDVAPGTRLLDVSDRPLIALALPFPLYRDIHVGDTGADVAALQEALHSLGLYSGAIDSSFGPATSSAIAKLYSRVGSEPPGPGPAELDALQSAKSAYAQELATPGGDVPADVARSTLEVLRAELNRAQEAALAWVAAGEVVAIPVSGAVVNNVPTVGAVLEGEDPVMSLRAGSPRVTFRVGLTDAERFRPSTAVSVSAIGTRGEPVAGTVSTVSEFQEADADAGTSPGYDVTVDVQGAAAWADGASVSVALAASEAAQSGLVVPVTAVKSDSVGTYVERVPDQKGATATGSRNAAAPRERVDVQPGLQDAGMVLVEGALEAGDVVVVEDSTS